MKKLNKILQKIAPSLSFFNQKNDKGHTILLYLFFLLPLSFTGFAQSISINTSGAIPDSSAMLDIMSADKGLLIPRVNLLSITDSGTIAHPAISLQVYNTNDSMTGGGKGFWYWNGTQWKRVSSDGIENVWGTTGNAGTLAGTNFIGTTDNVDLLIKTNNTERMRVLSGGNVGIGITTPLQKLHIETTTTANAIAATNLSTTGNAYGGVFRATGVGATNNFGIYAQTSGANTANYNIYSGSLTAGANNYSIYSVAAAQSYHQGAFNIGSTIPIQVAQTGSPTKVTIADVTNNTVLHIKEYANSVAVPMLVFGKSRGTSIGSEVATQNNDYFGTIGFEGVNTSNNKTEAGRIEFRQDGTGGVARIPGRIEFRVSDTTSGLATRVTIKNDGKVGIGTTSPATSLHIAQAVNDEFEALRLQNTDGSGSYRTSVSIAFNHFSSSNPSAKIVVKESGPTASYKSQMEFWVRGSSSNIDPDVQAITIIPTGNVGIGTTNPQSRLDVYDNGFTGGNYVLGVHADDENPYAFGFFNDAVSTTVPNFAGYARSTATGNLVAGDFLLGNNANNKLVFYTNGSNNQRMTITGAGNVGIGTTSPTAILHLKAGTSTVNTAPLKFTSGINLSTAETGAMEYNGTNLLFTRTGTTRETVITANSVNTVTPTSPNRTITVVIDGVTYYIAAKTTND